MIGENGIYECKKNANQIRRDILMMTYATGNTGAHLGGSLSMAEMLSVLYTLFFHYDVSNPLWEERDRVILSKGHAALALYPALSLVGIISREELTKFKKNGSKLSGHPSLNGLPGIEFASGSLGQGLSLAVGTSIALKRKKNDKSRVFVFLGDGECDEGSIWEAAASASHYNLNNIVAIVDANGIQYDGTTSEILEMNPLKEKWQAFGWDAVEIDGHDVGQLIEAYGMHTTKPLVLIANTIKGKGISYMEGDKKYHNARINKEQYESALEELELEI